MCIAKLTGEPLWTCAALLVLGMDRPKQHRIGLNEVGRLVKAEDCVAGVEVETWFDQAQVVVEGEYLEEGRGMQLLVDQHRLACMGNQGEM